MKRLPPNKRLRTALKQTKGAIRSVQTLADGPLEQLEAVRKRLSECYRDLARELDALEAKP